MRYRGVEATINVVRPANGNDVARYEELHERLYGYRHAGRPVEIVAARVEVVGTTADPPENRTAPVRRHPKAVRQTTSWFHGAPCGTGVFHREDLHAGDEIFGPAIVCESTSTIVIEPGFRATVLGGGELLLEDQGESRGERASTEADPVRLEIFNNLFASIAEQMGTTLQRTSCSTNVKERLDFSCAVFSQEGDLVVNAPHIPVHLGAMSETVKRILADNPNMNRGDVFVTNDPYRGGSHLPDVTVVTPVLHPASGRLLFFTGRAHHAKRRHRSRQHASLLRSLGEEGVDPQLPAR
jgi:5-oxoprolinase (ATP-hydrolysing)